MEKTLPYEFHVTVEADEVEPDRFRELCSQVGVKAIILDLGINNRTELSDFMTSSTAMLDDDVSALNELERIATGLGQEGLSVVRRKIESAPWHPRAPQTEGQVMPDDCYFEAHLGISVTEESVEELRGGLRSRSKLPLHLSRNLFKRNPDGSFTIMATLRDHDTIYLEFAEKVDEARGTIEDMGFALTKPPITEFALYDTNVHHDDVWMRQTT